MLKKRTLDEIYARKVAIDESDDEYNRRINPKRAQLKRVSAYRAEIQIKFDKWMEDEKAGAMKFLIWPTDSDEDDKAEFFEAACQIAHAKSTQRHTVEVKFDWLEDKQVIKFHVVTNKKS